MITRAAERAPRDGRAALALAAAALGLFLPSSVEGQILRALTVIDLAATVAVLGGMVALGLTKDRWARACAVAVPATLTLTTWISPFESHSPGLVAIYGALALLYLVDLRGARLGTLEGRALLALHILLAGAGVAIVVDVSLLDRLLVWLYSAFYPTLVPRMVALQKPVLTFATHSLAALLFYFLFLTALAGHAARGSAAWLVLVPTHLMLLLLLRSTTSIVLTVCATAVLVARGWRGSAWHGVAVAAAVAAAAGLVVAVVHWTDRPVVDLVSYGVLGDRRRGLSARFAPGGLLAPTLAYIQAHPWRPIGITYTDQLYLGDSGILMTWLRGSLPLFLAVYGGLFRFLVTNLASARMAVWLWVVIVAAEVALVPLQYFRFVTILPLTVVALNTFGIAGEVSRRDQTARMPKGT
jgi:hypothetical protein